MDAEHKVDIFDYDKEKSKDVSVRDDVGPESDKAKAVQIKEGVFFTYPALTLFVLPLFSLAYSS